MKYSAIAFFSLALLGGCVSRPFALFERSSWMSTENENAKGTVRIVSTFAEKSGEWSSLEKEINGLLPLIFLEEGYTAVSDSRAADYFAEAAAREREYIDGWRTRRSLSVELRLWAAGGDSFLPLAAGRAVSNGKRSLSSSLTLGAMLRKALRNAVRQLPAKDSGEAAGGADSAGHQAAFLGSPDNGLSPEDPR